MNERARPVPTGSKYAWVLGLAMLLAACGGGGSSGGGSAPGGQEPGTEEPGAPGPGPGPEPAPEYFRDGPVDPPWPPRAEQAPMGQWLATDTHVHTDHSSDGSMWRQASSDALPGNVAVSDQIGQAVSKKLDFVAMTDHRTYDQHWDPLWTSDRLLLIPGEEANGRPHANVLGAWDTVLDGIDGPSGQGHRPTQQSIWDASSQGAVWQVNHPDRDGTHDDGSANEHGSVLGVHLVEVWNRARFQYLEEELRYAESRWNLGMEFGISASSDNHFRELWLGFGPGEVKTHVFAPARTERAILQALRQGRTVLTQGGSNAAFVTLEADVQDDGLFEAVAGDTVWVRGNQPVTLRVRVQRGVGQTLKLFTAPGREQGPAQTVRPSRDDQTFLFTVARPLTETPFWAYAELTSALGERRALTSPIFLRNPLLSVPPAGELPVPEALALEDDAVRALGVRGQFSGLADVARDGAGVPLVVAEQHEAIGTQVVFRRGDSPEPVVLNRLGQAGRWPRIAAAGNQVWVAWEDERSGQMPRRPQIMLRGSADGGHSWGDEIRLTRSEGRAIRPALAVLPDGTPVMAWSDNQRRCFDLFVQVGLAAEAENLTAQDKECHAGHAFDTRSTLDPASLHPALAVQEDGRITVVFQDNRFDVNPGWTGHTGFHDGLEGIDRTDPDNWEILARSRDPLSGEWSPVVRVSNNGDPEDAFDETALADRHPDVTVSAEGQLLAVWDAKVLRAAGVNSAIHASVSDDGGRTWSPPVAVGVEDQAMSQRPSVGRRADGSILAVWMDSRDRDWRHRVWGSTWTADQGWSPARRWSGAGNGTWPRFRDEHLVFHSDRGADLQRDPTWRVQYRHRPRPVEEAPQVAAGARMLLRADRLMWPTGTLSASEWRRRWQERVADMAPIEDCHDHGTHAH